jgi:hypothetical protein
LGRRFKQLKQYAEDAAKAAQQTAKAAKSTTACFGLLSPTDWALDILDYISDPEEYARRLNDDGIIIFPGAIVPPLTARRGRDSRSLPIIY